VGGTRSLHEPPKENPGAGGAYAGARQGGLGEAHEMESPNARPRLSCLQNAAGGFGFTAKL